MGIFERVHITQVYWHFREGTYHTGVHTDERLQVDKQWPLSVVHSIMMVNSSQTGEGGGCTPSPFTHEQSCGVRSIKCSWEGADTLLLFLLYPFLLCGFTQSPSSIEQQDYSLIQYKSSIINITFLNPLPTSRASSHSLKFPSASRPG